VKLSVNGGPVSQVRYLNDVNGELQAIYIPATAKSDGVKFLTTVKNDMQVGLMTRNSNSPVVAHQHLKINRSIETTQEFLLVRKGSAEVILLDDHGNHHHEIHLSLGDSILLVGGAHAINFTSDTELLEVKQGPYLESQDKAYLGSNHAN
jgi:hypothetical protein